MKLKPVKLGLTLGIIWGANIFFTTWLSYLVGYGGRFLAIMMNLYPWYNISPIGSLIGFAYGFLDLFAGGLLVGLIYNALAKES